MGKLNKRGQITIFIILGIIILFSSAAYFYTKGKLTTLQPNTIETKKTTALHPFVEACMELEVREALNIIGMTGGYINYPFSIQNDPASYLRVAPIGEAKMPYWWYAGEERIPPLDFIQGEIENYTITHINDCLNNFSAINGYDVFKTGKVDVKITIADKSVNAQMKYPLRAVKVPEQNEFSLNDYDFFIKIPINFKQVYEVAKKIMEDENRNYFMEKFTMDLISLGDTGDEKASTPLMNMDFRLRPYIWLLPSVQSTLKDLLTANLQLIKFTGTNFTEIPDVYPYQYSRNHNNWTFDNAAVNSQKLTYPNIKVGVTYDANWKPFRLDVSPTKATVLKSGQTPFGGALSWIGWQTWHFTYDLVYPVMITIKDDSGKDSEPYFFSYAFLVSIRHNQPYKQNFGSTIFTTPDTPSDEETCAYLKESGNVITISTYNNYTQKPRNGVNLTFTCGRYTCPLGQTEWTSNGATAELKTNFPRCAWGILRGYREGFENAEMFMSSEQEKTVPFYLKPVSEFKNYDVLKHIYDPKMLLESRRVGPESNLSNGEQAVIILKTPGMADQYATYPANSSDAVTPLKFYKDAQFSYNVTIYLFKQGETEDDGKLLGAYEAEFTPDAKTVAESNYIKFHVLQYSSTSEEELGLFLAGIRSYSEKISKPEFEKR